MKKLVAECVGTMFLVLLACGSAVLAGPSIGGLGIGICFGAIGLALGLVNIVGIPVDNCSVNPARSFGPALWDSAAWPDFWIMVVGPCVGAVIAVLCWNAISSSRNKKEIA